jgi:iron complex transport system permease protein
MRLQDEPELPAQMKIVPMIADISARFLLKPLELLVGVMTALVGAPFFVYLAKSKVKK